MLNKWKDIPLWVKIVIIIPLFIFPLAVHFLFIMPAVSSIFEAQWSAGELLSFCGGYLAFLGPTMLSFVALKQNEEFKKSNDEAQSRLEMISKRSNQLNMINVIIEHETKKLERMNNTIDTIIQESYIENYINIMGENESNMFEGNVLIGKNALDFRQKHNLLETLLWSVLREINELNRPYAKELRNSLEKLFEEILKVSNILAYENDMEKYKKECELLGNARADVQKQRIFYVASYYKDLDKAMYTPMTLKEVRNLFNPPKKEHTNNGKNENGIPESDRSEC